MRSYLTILAAAVVLAAAATRTDAGGAGGALVPDEVVRLLERHGVPFDEADLRRAAAAAMLKAADAGGELLDADAALWWSTNRSIACATQWPDDLAYVRLNGCFDADAAELGDAVRSVVATNCQGLIVDLRGAEGCSAAAMSAVIGLIAGDGADPVGIRRAQSATTEVVRAVGPALDPMPPVVLVSDRRTRGAAEGLVWGLKGRPGVLVLGDATAGDGAARERVALGGGYTALLGTGRYVRRDGEPVPREGIPPDLAVAGGDGSGTTPSPGKPAGDEAAPRALMHRIGSDGVLRRAADLLLGLRAMASAWESNDDPETNVAPDAVGETNAAPAAAEGGE